MKQLVAYLSLGWLALGLTGCFLSNNERAGGEDFPNTLGTIVASNLNESSGWNKLDSAPKTVPDQNLNQNNNAPLNKVALPKPEPMLKLSNASTPLEIDSVKIDTLGNLVYVYQWKSSVDSAVRETSVVLYDQIYQDSGLSKANYVRVSALTLGAFFNNPLSYFSVEDADGDSIINAKPNQLNRSKTTSIIYSIGGNTQAEFIMDAGPDDDFGSDDNAATQDNLIVSSKGVQYYPGGDILRVMRWEDGDGDGIISPDSTQPQSLVEFVIETYFAGTVTTDSFVIGAGSDHNFETESDNPILSIQSTLQNNQGDTLTWTKALDADGDGILYDSLMDSSIITLETFDNTFPNLLFPPKKETSISLVIFPSDSTKNYAIKFKELKTWNNGATELGTVFGPQPDSSFAATDTIDISATWTGNSTDSSSYRKVHFKAGLGANPALDEDNEMYSFQIQAQFRFGEQSYVELNATPGEPLKDGEDFDTGSLSGIIVFGEADTVLISAQIFEDHMEAEVTLPDQKTISAKWDRQGNPL